MIRGLSLAFVVILLAAVGCGRGPDEPTADAGAVARDDTGDEVLDAIAAAIGSGGWVASASVPEGGAVLAGAATSTGGRQRFDSAGVVLDREAEPTVAFELPEPVLVTGIVAGDGTAMLAGVVCEGASREDENTGVRDCAPGRVVGYRVDLRSGEVSVQPLPEAVRAAGSLMSGRPLSLFRSGPGSVVLVAGVGAPDELQAWRLAEPDRWEPVEAPSSLPCQVGDHLLSHDVGSSTEALDPDRTEEVTPSVRVFDHVTGTWGGSVSGPALEGVVGMPPSVVCSQARLVAVPHGGGSRPVALATFDPSTSRWETLDVPASEVQLAPIAHPGLRTILIYSLAVKESAPAIEYDPVTGEHRPSTLALGSYATFVPVTGSAAIVFHQDGTSSRMDFT